MHVVSVPTEELEAAMGPLDDVEIVRWDLTSAPPRPRFDIVVAPYLVGPEPLARLAGVDARLVQWQSIGVDGVADFLPQGIALANATGVHETSTAELALALTLAMQRGVPDLVRSGEAARWRPVFRPSLADRRVLLVGYGGVARAIEERLVPFETEIVRIARTPRRTSGPRGEAVQVDGLDDLHARLAEADIVILAVPLNLGTRGLIGAEALAAMPDGSLLVNIARGAVVDTDALVAELQSGRLRAALDVTDPEPLPPQHPLWRCPNTLVSPHLGGASSAMLPRMVRLLQRQIARLRAGEEPENLVITGA